MDEQNSISSDTRSTERTPLRSAESPLHVTPRQAQILELVALGLSDKEIARELGLSRRTIGSHLRRVFEENGMHKRSAMVAAWLRLQPNGG